MESQTITRARKMDVTTLTKKLNDGGFSLVDRPMIESIIAEKSAGSDVAVEIKSPTAVSTTKKPLSITQQLIAKAHITGAIVAKTQAPKVEEEVKVSSKHKPNETTQTLESFTDDTKGLRKGQTVCFPNSNKPGAPLMEGKIQRIFGFIREVREEAKILGTDGKRYYRFEPQLQPVTPIVETPAAE